MRERVFLQSVVPGVYHEWHYRTPDYLRNEMIPYQKSSHFVGMVDVVTPNFHKERSKGELYNNPLWQVDNLVSQEPSMLYGKGLCPVGINYEYNLWHMIPPKFSIDALDTGVLDTVANEYSSESEIAQTQAWANIDVSEIAGAASLGELPETVEWLADLFKTFLELTTALRRKDIKKIIKIGKKLKTVDGAGDLWLSYRYALRPLISDVLAALNALQAELEKGMRFTARGKYSCTEGPSSSTIDLPFENSWSGIDGSFWRLSCTRNWQSTRSYRAGVLVEVDRSIDTAMAIWGLDNPLEAIWELTSLSFIWDWFFNIGSVLNALLLNPGLSPKLSYVTEVFDLEDTVRVIEGHPGPNYSLGCSQSIEPWQIRVYGQTSQKLMLKRRVPLAKRYSLPHINVRLDVAKLTDILLIARKLLRS